MSLSDLTENWHGVAREVRIKAVRKAMEVLYDEEELDSDLQFIASFLASLEEDDVFGTEGLRI